MGRREVKGEEGKEEIRKLARTLSRRNEREICINKERQIISSILRKPDQLDNEQTEQKIEKQNPARKKSVHFSDLLSTKYRPPPCALIDAP